MKAMSCLSSSDDSVSGYVIPQLRNHEVRRTRTRNRLHSAPMFNASSTPVESLQASSSTVQSTAQPSPSLLHRKRARLSHIVPHQTPTSLDVQSKVAMSLSLDQASPYVPQPPPPPLPEAPEGLSVL